MKDTEFEDEKIVIIPKTTPGIPRTGRAYARYAGIMRWVKGLRDKLVQI